MDENAACCTECGFTTKDMLIFASHIEQHERHVNDADSERSADWSEEHTNSPTSSPRASVSSGGEKSPSPAVGGLTKSEKRAHVCPHCNFTTYMSQHMKSHLEAHERHQGQMYQCDICQMQFSQKANMHRHRMRHSGVKPYECRYCKKRFFRKDQMQEHSMTHIKTGADFDCPVATCDAVFAQHAALRAHLDDSHTISASSPASCKLCTLLFSNSRRLLLHYQTKHDENEPARILSNDTKQEKEETVVRKKRAIQSPPQPRTILPNPNLIPAPLPHGLALLPGSAIAATLQSQIQQFLNKGLLPSLHKETSNRSEYEGAINPLYGLTNEEILLYLSNNVQQSIFTEAKAESAMRLWNNEMCTMPSPLAPQAHSPSLDSGASSSEDSTKDSLECVHCGIVFFDRTMQLLHKGLHSETDPWRCNLCGHPCADKYMFTTHIISSNHTA